MFWYDKDFMEEEWSLSAKLFARLVFNPFSVVEYGIFAEVVSSNGKDPVDEQAIFRVSLQRLFHRLSDNENRYIRHKAMDGMLDVSIRKRLRITFPDLYEMKRNIRRQIESASAV